MSPWSGEELRRSALEALGEHADERARDALVHASIEIVIAAAGWTGSGGPVQAHRVTLGFDARTLGGLRAAPALKDALCAALASAIAARPGETLLDLQLRWMAEPRAAPAGYRDAPPNAPDESLLDALTDYLAGAGQQALAASLVGGAAHRTGRADVSLSLGPSAREALRSDARALATLTAALEDLVAEEKLRIRVR